MKNRYKIKGDTVVIYLNYHGKEVETVIELNDFELVNAFPNTWSIQEDQRGLYVRGEVERKGVRSKQYMHRLIMGNPASLYVDHMNRDTLDNRRTNLRVVTNQQNQQNQKVHVRSKSGIKGVIMYKGRWQVCVGNVYLGRYDSLCEAEEVAKAAYKEYLPYYIYDQGGTTNIKTP